MEMIKILLVTEDMHYGRSFCDCVRKMNIGVNVSLDNKVNKIEDYDLILSDCTEHKLENSDDKPIIELVENREVNSDVQVYKYDRISKLISNILIIFAEKTGRIMGGAYVNKTKCKIYMVTSPYGGAGSSSVAMAMAKDVALAGREKVLYLSTKNSCEELMFRERSIEENLREYIFDIIKTDKKRTDKMMRHIDINDYGVCTFNVDILRNELNRINIEDFQKVVVSIVETGCFNKVIVDNGNNLSDSTYWIGEISDGIVFIGDKRNLNYEKEYLAELDIKDNDQKLIKVRNFEYKGKSKFEDFFEDEEDEDENCILLYREDEAFFCVDGLLDIDLSGEFGKGIREIISKLNDINRN